MTYLTRISTFIFALAVSCLLSTPAKGQQRKHVLSSDSTAWLQGLEVSADLVGPVMKAIGDYGHIEGALRINLKDRYFPVFELGYASCDHTEKTTSVNYQTKAPYGKVGIDFNILKDKRDIYRLYIGARYALTSFKADYSAPPVEDPIWRGTSEWAEKDMKCKYHWLEAVAGIQAKIWGPIDLGWSARYLKRLSYSEGDYSRAWYVPGYGKSGNSNFIATFNIIFGI